MQERQVSARVSLDFEVVIASFCYDWIHKVSEIQLMKVSGTRQIASRLLYMLWNEAHNYRSVILPANSHHDIDESEVFCISRRI